jgi:DNA-directed RNA polymerase subunit RPC12/RpoP
MNIFFVEEFRTMDGCPNCGSHILYGCYYSDVKFGHVVCDRCSADIFEEKDRKKVELNLDKIKSLQ